LPAYQRRLRFDKDLARLTAEDRKRFAEVAANSSRISDEGGFAPDCACEESREHLASWR